MQTRPDCTLAFDTGLLVVVLSDQMNRAVLFILLMIHVLAWSLASSAQQTECSSKLSRPYNQMVREFMTTQHLILKGEEVTLPLFNILTRWELTSVVDYNSTCLAVMSLCQYEGLSRKCDLAHDVFGIIKDKKTKKERVALFSEVYPTSEKLIAKVGSQPDFRTKEDPSYYYVEFEGSSVVEALKAVATGLTYAGFSGVAERTGKNLFDPTENRHWKITSSQFSLRRGTAAKQLDIQSYELDGFNYFNDPIDANNYWNTCQRHLLKPNTCVVAPWFQSYIISIFPTHP